ncbi:hypothetical protein DFH28DRAFT_896366 [Melampsora americana]|nr:hypothetical protein DFH28DRAFT_896366 [Melampsora americana]
MVLPGEKVQPENKRSRTGQRLPTTSTGRRLANLMGSEARASEGRLALLNAPPAVPHQVPPQLDAGQAAIYDNVVRPDEMEVSSDDGEQQPQFDRSDYFRGTTYQERRLREEENWKAVMPAIFLAFMPCSHKTIQWADPLLWDNDFNKPCNCPVWKQKVVEIDAIDFIGEVKKEIRLCQCTPDVVRLVRHGYMGCSPKSPRTAFSLRLLRYHHILWKHCCIRLAPFVESQDEYLDAHASLLLVTGTNKSRDWRIGFSAAVDAYREIMRLQDELTVKALRLNARDQLASICPPCFGPKVPGKRPKEPDVVVCFDGNFQHRRHKAASAGWRGESGVMPALFLPSENVKSWEIRMNTYRAVEKDVIHPCTQQHTAADDVRGRQTFPAYDDTGLMGMACRHDQILKFINIVQSGERGHFPVAMLDWLLKQSEEDMRYGVLYDIGCNMEKGILKVGDI